MTSKEKNQEAPPANKSRKWHWFSANTNIYKVNKEMLPYKMHFFLFIGAMGAILPYLTVFAKTKLGLTATALSTVYIVQQLSFGLAKPLIGLAVDHFNKMKCITIALMIMQIILYFSLLPIPKIQPDGVLVNKEPAVEHQTDTYHISSLKSLYEENSNSSTEIPYKHIKDIYRLEATVQNFTHSKFLLITNSTASFQEDTELAEKDAMTNTIYLYTTYQFWLFSVIMITAGICSSTLFTLADTACYEGIEKARGQYGHQRMWGAVSWGIIAPLSGITIDYTQSYISSCIIMASLLILSIINISRLDIKLPYISKNIFKDVGIVFSSKEFIAFDISVFLNGVFTGFIWFYLVWFVVSIGGSQFLMGMAHLIQCFVGELPFMFISGWMINKLGHFNVVTLSFVAYAIRFYGYSQLNNPWLLLPYESLHGLTYGVFYSTITSYAKYAAQPGTETTTQAVLCSTYEGLGAGLGCVFAGLGFDNLGGHRTFFWASMCSIIAALFNFVNSILLNKRKNTLHINKRSKEKY